MNEDLKPCITCTDTPSFRYIPSGDLGASHGMYNLFYKYKSNVQYEKNINTN